MRSIPPITSTGRLRSADPVLFRTRMSTSPDDLPPVRGERFEKPERPRPSACGTCGSTNINGAEERGGAWHVWCVACDSLQPAKKVQHEKS